MQELPHHYKVESTAESEGLVTLSADGLPTLDTAPPAEYGGPGDQWSPETLLVAAVADCFILTFRAIARISKLEWTSLTCNVNGVLDKVDGTTRFTELFIRAGLRIPAGTAAERASRLLERAEKGCLITNSLLSQTHLEVEIHTVD